MCGMDVQSPSVKRENGISRRATPPTPTTISSDTIINLDHGDPTIFESYWQKMGDKCTVVIKGGQSLSYFADKKNLCWFLEAELKDEIIRLHDTVGNAATDVYNIVVGNGSTQLIQAALYALSPSDSSQPMNVVSAAPYYSCYPDLVDFLRSGLYKWAGDANVHDKKEGPYIEFVTSPNNPDGTIREAVVKGGGQGKVVHDLAYYWPQYTPITCRAHFDVMLFTVSKCTGHAGSRIGWALVKDEGVARRMTKFIEISTIGVSKESQLRAAKVLGAISESCLNPGMKDNFFGHGQELMWRRWEMLRQVVGNSELFSLPDYANEYCLFTGKSTPAHPAFAWIKCNKNIEDLEKFLKEKGILCRSGKRFGSAAKFVRISMLSREEEFSVFLERLLVIEEKLKMAGEIPE